MKEFKIGNIVAETGYENLNKFGIKAVIWNKTGQGWGLPLENITSKDLRDLADLLDKQEKIQEKENIEKIKNKIIDYCKKEEKSLLLIQDLDSHNGFDVVEKHILDFNSISDKNKLHNIWINDYENFTTLLNEKYSYFEFNQADECRSVTMMFISKTTKTTK